ncbi:hypothetical protein G5V59_24945 [Nocardioides sp. W3-2-3]|nr:hypothetical protein [Nocardioides convexus]
MQQTTTAAPHAPGKARGRAGPCRDPAVPGRARHLAAGTALRARRAWTRPRSGRVAGASLAGDMSLALALWKAISDRYQARVRDLGRRPGAAAGAGADLGADLGAPRRRDRAPGRAGRVAARGGAAVRRADRPACAAGWRWCRGRTSRRRGSGGCARRLERIRDQVGLEPANTRDAAIETLAGLLSRLEVITAKAERGGDVGGLLGPMEAEATTFERDLIVGNARRRDARSKVISARERARTWRLARRPCRSSPRPAWRPSTPRPATRSPTSTRSARCR